MILEGVVTEEAVDFPCEADCVRLQGYYYGKPVRYEEILAEFKDGSLKLGKNQIKIYPGFKRIRDKSLFREPAYVNPLDGLGVMEQLIKV